jgi:hypothetical protein
MAKKLGIDGNEIEGWWYCTRQQVNQHLKLHRNNTIKGLKNSFKLSGNC